MLTVIEGEILDRADRFVLSRSEERERDRQRDDLLRLLAEIAEPTCDGVDVRGGVTPERKAAWPSRAPA